MSDWAGHVAGSNGRPARGYTNGPKGSQKASTQQDVENYFKINEIPQLVNLALNSVAEERPADFKKGLQAALTAHAAAGLASPEAAKKAPTKQDAEEAKKYLEKNNAEAILSEILGKVAATMPPNAASALVEYAATATGAGAYKEEKKKEEKKEEPAAKKEEPAAAGGEKKSKDEKKDEKKEKRDEQKDEKKGKEEPQAADENKPVEISVPPPPAPPSIKAEEASIFTVCPAGCDNKKWKAAVKEGGKKGVELAGCADMGGLEFFTTQIEAAEGDLVLVECAMMAANKEVDPTEEEAKGGSGEVGKMLLSSGDKQLALMCYVPDSKLDKCNATEWMKAVLQKVGGEFLEGSAKTAKGRAVADGSTRFPLKDKDTCQAESVNWLKSKGLFPQADKEEDDWVPGDDAGIEW